MKTKVFYQTQEPSAEVRTPPDLDMTPEEEERRELRLFRFLTILTWYDGADPSRCGYSLTLSVQFDSGHFQSVLSLVHRNQVNLHSSLSWRINPDRLPRAALLSIEHVGLQLLHSVLPRHGPWQTQAELKHLPRVELHLNASLLAGVEQESVKQTLSSSQDQHCRTCGIIIIIHCNVPVQVSTYHC